MNERKTDMRDIVRTGGFANYREVERAQSDYYATEPKAGELLLQLDNFSDIWECACGAGHLAKVFENHGLLKKASDLYDRGYGESNIDFLFYTDMWDGDIVTNPPYFCSAEFITHGMKILKEKRKLALLLPTRYLEGKERRRIFDLYPPYKVWVSSGRINCARNGKFEEMTGSAMSYAWYIWHKGYDGETKLGWFNNDENTDSENSLFEGTGAYLPIMKIEKKNKVIR